MRAAGRCSSPRSGCCCGARSASPTSLSGVLRRRRCCCVALSRPPRPTHGQRRVGRAAADCAALRLVGCTSSASWSCRTSLIAREIVTPRLATSAPASSPVELRTDSRADRSRSSPTCSRSAPARCPSHVADRSARRSTSTSCTSSDPAATRRTVARLEQLAVDAFGSPTTSRPCRPPRDAPDVRARRTSIDR